MCISGIFAIGNQTETVGKVSTGAVNIELEETIINTQNQEEPYTEESKLVFPGQEIPLICRIENLGVSCYVRAKVITVNEDLDIDEMVEYIADNWIKIGDYYYYKTPINSSTNVTLFNKVKIPSELPNGYEGKKIVIQINAEAIQARNFNPDFQAEDPWKGMEIEKCIEDSYEIGVEPENDRSTVIYENDTQDYVKVEQTIFSKLKSAVPGDTKTEKIGLIGKEKNKNTKYYLTIREKENTTEELELLNNIQLTITREGEVLYQGNILGCSKVLLGEYKAGEKGQVVMSMYIPETLQNKYSLLNPTLEYIFSSEDEPKSSVLPINPKTGDFKIDIHLTIFFLSTICFIYTLLLTYKEKNKN